MICPNHDDRPHPHDFVGAAIKESNRIAGRYRLRGQELYGHAYEIVDMSCRQYRPGNDAKPITYVTTGLIRFLPKQARWEAGFRGSGCHRRLNTSGCFDDVRAHPGTVTIAEREEIAAALRRLDDRSRFVLEHRARGMTLETIAGMLGLSRQRIAQIEKTAVLLARSRATRP